MSNIIFFFLLACDNPHMFVNRRASLLTLLFPVTSQISYLPSKVLLKNDYNLLIVSVRKAVEKIE